MIRLQRTQAACLSLLSLTPRLLYRLAILAGEDVKPFPPGPTGTRPGESWSTSKGLKEAEWVWVVKVCYLLSWAVSMRGHGTWVRLSDSRPGFFVMCGQGGAQKHLPMLQSCGGGSSQAAAGAWLT